MVELTDGSDGDVGADINGELDGSFAIRLVRVVIMVVVTVVAAVIGRVVLERGMKTRMVVSGTNSASGPLDNMS